MPKTTQHNADELKHIKARAVTRASRPLASTALLPTHSVPFASPAGIMQLQRTAGNAAVNHLIQCKLIVGAANDPLEREADRVAERVVSGGAAQAQPASARGLHRNAIEEDELLTKRDAMMSRFDAGNAFEQQLDNAGGGAPLDAQTRSQMEAGIGTDFSKVRIHTGTQAAQLNRSISARAFTRGTDVFFAHGQYNPGSTAGKRLIAHELTHVVQQGGAYPAAAGAQRQIVPHIQREGEEDDERIRNEAQTQERQYRGLAGGANFDKPPAFKAFTKKMGLVAKSVGAGLKSNFNPRESFKLIQGLATQSERLHKWEQAIREGQQSLSGAFVKEFSALVGMQLTPALMAKLAVISPAKSSLLIANWLRAKSLTKKHLAMWER